ncbi:hypothetical protein [Legionella jordanis]|uniref:Uncharacterized protein n=1 Tax=Legionella jordanis TaxID=456 RepID=A0A0W0VFL2_9GAMM|nr:hypothetical protein [Legionella jordanis]KTD18887.1 hypothetical protein Ljor_0110 [Legionella jordanis]RMX05545.1 hypothetical protein EAW55_02530 [Legionella jordanis]RMX19230.1 hypothetical protein EAS68_07295 [Legionella jordanis]VEH12987.1 Uncharacterised protein [Legionella jordanis]HAT8714030.1 hypothetical protein [Legionella jordanis]
MNDFKSKLPDFKELSSFANKLFKDVKKSVTEIIDDYKKKREQTAEQGEVVSSASKTAEKKDEAVVTAAKKTSEAGEEVVVASAKKPGPEGHEEEVTVAAVKKKKPAKDKTHLDIEPPSNKTE